MRVYVNSDNLATLLSAVNNDLFTNAPESREAVAAAERAAYLIGVAQARQLNGLDKIAGPGEYDALVYALDLAATLVAESEYGNDRKHKATDKLNLRLAWRLARRIAFIDAAGA